MAVVDERKQQGERTDLKNNLASCEAKSKQSKSADQTAKTVGISRAKVERTRAVLDHADEETKRSQGKAGGIDSGDTVQTAWVWF